MLPEKLEAIAATQCIAFTAEQAREHEVAIRQMRRTGRLTVVHKDVYARSDLVAAMDDPTKAALQASARLLVNRGDLVASHATAAAIHGFRLLAAAPKLPVLTEAAESATCRRRGIRVAALPASHRAVLHGVAVTSSARTVADCARVLSPLAGLVTADSALRAGVPRASVLDVLAYCSGWPGVRLAREVVAFADARSDSPLESGVRWQLAQAGLPAPELQLTICDEDGRDEGDVDFVWLAQRTILEADGRLKYAEPSALWREKRREDALRALGFEVVRCYWEDMMGGGAVIAARVRAAFALNAARTALPEFLYREKFDRHKQRLL